MDWESLCFISSHNTPDNRCRCFRNQLEKNGIDSYLHYPIKGYPTIMDHIISPEGMGKKTTTSKPVANLIVVTAPGPGSGKNWQLVCPICTTTNSMASSLVTLNLKPSQFGIFPFIIQSIWPTRLQTQTLTMSI